jgi:hypothetical protein
MQNLLGRYILYREPSDHNEGSKSTAKKVLPAACSCHYQYRFVGEKGAMKGAVSFLLAAVVSRPAVAAGQAFPVPLLGRPSLLPPAASRDGQTVLFGSAVTLSGVATSTTNLYVDLAVPNGDVLRQLTDFSGSLIPLGATAVSHGFVEACSPLVVNGRFHFLHGDEFGVTN